ncbi:phosphonate metabolism transcriptional regulator PhnF [Labrys monachus]|uniref:GntR family phosphonate transport system transcriptional regulator n=1 Tax=Labrys monachus TaxID=217067 RepID=A0ABU0FJG8_9HYPH|nr:phosphonate metabolism transcriptional regulator PhnF [Labrys monachus]MDQ0394671.1 GntR family phosphonate transport system transcriptional regulator [Labrys monachus]
MTVSRTAQDFIAAPRRDGIAAWRKIADALEADITGGTLMAGSQLPAETLLAERFAVNRHTVRRALAELTVKGLVRATQGRGTFVEARRLPYPIGPQTRFTQNVAREGREPGAALLAAAHVRADERIASLLALRPGDPVLRLDTLRSADGVPLTLGLSFVPLPRFAGLEAALRLHGAITPAFAACGVADYRRLETRVGARIALPGEAERLDLAPGRPVMVVDSINVDLDAVPIQATRALFAADRTEIVVQS